MSIELIGLITAALGVYATLRSSAAALTLVCCMGLLGAASAMAFGGANVTPGHLSLGFFTMAVLLRPGGLGYATLPMQRGGPVFVLLLLCSWGFISGLFLPRLFAGEFMVFPMSSDRKFIIEVPLYPSGSNFNHAIYFVSGLFVFAAVSSMARTNEMLKKAGEALIIAGILNIVIVLFDTVTFAVGAYHVLDFIRNADYAQIFYHKFLGVKRVTGSFPEASSFATTAVGLFAFNFRLWRGGVRTDVTGWIALGTLAAILFSFSSTGYLALIVYLTVAYSSVLIRADKNTPYAMRSSTNRIIFLSLGPVIAILGATAVAIKPDLIAPIVQTFDSSITNKLGSASGVERTTWNMVGLRAFFETFGLGAGIGSVRTSSFLVGVLANLGVIGTVLFGVFLARLFLVDRSARSALANDDSRQYAAAARAGCFTIFTASAVSSSSVDLGIHFFVMAGIACASLFYRKAPANVYDPSADEEPIMPVKGAVSARMRGQLF
ncbi:hypothetical protein WNY37_04715 [Henriciella sp. AS95]|uniref:hypothetical protein n=1 Tax=Henriciella sp. AS95 TaxID=3135782 RepID=UPI00317122C8